jgi:hypothetical protein
MSPMSAMAAMAVRDVSRGLRWMSGHQPSLAGKSPWDDYSAHRRGRWSALAARLQPTCATSQHWDVVAAVCGTKRCRNRSHWLAINHYRSDRDVCRTGAGDLYGDVHGWPRELRICQNNHYRPIPRSSRSGRWSKRAAWLDQRWGMRGRSRCGYRWQHGNTVCRKQDWGVWISLNGGRWRPSRGSPIWGNRIATDPSNPARIAVGGRAGDALDPHLDTAGLWESPDAGDTWVYTYDPFPDTGAQQIYDLAFAPTETLFLATAAG